MSDWWTYRLEDFLLFSPRVYWRMVELHNGAWWPLHLATLAAGIVILFVVLRRPHRRESYIILVLAAVWAFVGWAFLWERYAAINWAIVYVAPAFWLQALLLAILGVTGGLSFAGRDFAAQVALLLALAGLLAYPLLPLFAERPWSGGEVFGIAPDPTAIVTLGIVLTAGGRMPFALTPIPLLWLLTSGFTLRTMGDSQAWAPLLAAGIVPALLFWRHVRPGR
ncbi:DUF6064 family protein [Pseudaminobacter sp. NGMCC 1.201702]|uniref:DUF6064 family protein n=1 Tax=Pseudaminobacter sp. NGMCC 1.201702 TaxID=3391825 RepID=UPI0039EF8BF9